jgi:alkanesulfonate monooxygenase SsuD/methylene tetrahydromethanopterin reductase-like flavin-dependent oxidoreductase (luciferase family)
MQVGVAVICQNLLEGHSDRDVYLAELRLADLVEGLGFDSLWSVEHHFTDYTMVPDVTQFLSYMAARTQRVSLGSMVVVLPWHDPVRVAEELSLLDILCDGRLVVGIGRGAGRIEFDGLRIPQSESRGRFVEAAEIVLRALEDGRVAYEGEFYHVPARDIRPRPFRSFRGRTYGAMVSPETAEILAQLGVGLLIIPQKPWEEIAQDLLAYEAACRRHGTQPRSPIATGWVYCAGDEAAAEEGARRWIGNYWRSAMAHYEIGGAHFKEMKGYEYYGQLADMMDAAGPDAIEQITEAFVGTQVWGTPEQCLEKIREIEERVHNDHFIGVFSFGGMPYDEAERSLRLFAAEVTPALQGRRASPVPAVRRRKRAAARS